MRIAHLEADIRKPLVSRHPVYVRPKTTARGNAYQLFAHNSRRFDAYCYSSITSRFGIVGETGVEVLVEGLGPLGE